MLLINVVLPIFAIIFCGYIVGKLGVIPKDGSKILNNFVFYITLPALLFLSTATAPVEQLFNWHFLFINLGGILVSFLVAFFTARKLFKHTVSAATIFGMGASYGTTGYMGIPLVIAAFGPEAALPAALATLIHNLPIISIVLIIFESKRGEKNYKFIHLLEVFKTIIRNPLTIAVVAGIIIALFKIQLPTSILSFSQLLADASGATALFAIGLGLVGIGSFIKKTSFTFLEVGTLVFLKLALQPLVTLLLVLYVIDIDPLWGSISIVMSALPIGAGVYIFAQKYESYDNQSLFGIFISIILSLVTISIILLLLI